MPAAEVATRAFFTRTGFVDGESATAEFLAVKLGNGGVGFFLGLHLDEGESTGLVGELVHDKFATSDFAGLFEQVENFAFGGVERQVTYE
jgi:hypothetical protein